MRSLTLAELNAAWRKHIDPARMTVSIAGDPAKGIR
jgi:predicted Zn-dependent peptidase